MNEETVCWLSLVIIFGLWLLPLLKAWLLGLLPDYKRLEQQCDHWKSLYIQERSERLRLEWMLNEHGERWKTE